MLDQVPTSATFLWTAILGIPVAMFWYRKRRGSRFPLPPGPTPIPIIGNLLSIPTCLPWVTYANWSQKYKSDLVSFTAFGQVFVVVNSLAAAKELFEHRSATYSSRPRRAMVDMSGWGFGVGFMLYGDEWRARRRLLHLALVSGKATAYLPLQIAKTEELLRRLYKDPEGCRDHLQASFASLAMDITYGHDIELKNDRFVELAEKSLDNLTAATSAAGILNLIPMLLHLPSWVPGMNCKILAEKCTAVTLEMLQVPWNTVKHQLAAGTARPSLAATWIAQNEESAAGAEADRAARDAAGVIYAAGSDTSVSTLAAALLALLTNPHVQSRARDEIDSVVPRTRLPTFDDRPHLPYVGAVVREVLRWHHSLPLSFARVAGTDDNYDGMFIPKGAQIIPNLWAMTHDSRIYSEPHKFKPERFLLQDGNLNDDESQTTFGFGRRVCPGQHLVEATIWITITSFLAVYRILPAEDVEENDIQIKVAFSARLGIATSSYPHPFECSIVPRDAEAEELLQSLGETSE